MGVLGFLSLDVLSKHVHPPTSGNYGLSDIVQALRWIQLNIEHFGGDPTAVTLFGHRAGKNSKNLLQFVLQLLFFRCDFGYGFGHCAGSEHSVQASMGVVRRRNLSREAVDRVRNG